MDYPASFAVRIKSDRSFRDFGLLDETAIRGLHKTRPRLKSEKYVLSGRQETLRRIVLRWLILSSRAGKLQLWTAALRSLERSHFTSVFDEIEKPIEQPPRLEFVILERPRREDRARTIGRFTPGQILVNFWLRGLKSHMQEYTPESFLDRLKGFFAKANDRAMSEAFAKKLTRMFSVLANRQKHGIHDYHAFSENGRFSVAVQHQILDRFPIIPDEATEFFGRLHEELVEYLGAGGSLQGRWGKLVLKGRDLILRTEKNESPTTTKKWRAANILE